MACLVQYVSAKLGLVTGRTLPEALRTRMPRAGRLAYWGQAELVAMATDLAEVLGGAIALNILFGLPLLLGGVITGVVSTGLLAVQNQGGQRAFERVIIEGRLSRSASWPGSLSPHGRCRVLLAGCPAFDGSDSVLLAAGMLGATIMPHAVYLHAALARDRHGRAEQTRLHTLLTATRRDIGAAMLLAGATNLAMLLLAASSLHGAETDGSLQGAHDAVGTHLGQGVALLFALGLLASGLASTAVGGYAGAVVMEGLLERRVPLQLRRTITLIPALVNLAVGVDPTTALVLSQVVLSFGIPFVLIH